MTLSPIERAVDSFAAELSRRRVQRGMTKKQLAMRMGFDPSYVSHIEGRRHRPTADFARRAEAVLGASGAIWQRFREYDELRQTRTNAAGQHGRPVPEQWRPAGPGLIIEREEATLTHRPDHYRCVIRRSLRNTGTEPVTRHLIRVAVDRYPNDPGRSNHHHHCHPLTFAELGLRAYRDDQGTREPMRWRCRHDRDAFKEVWLLFENPDGRFPLYPGQRTEIEYSYTVGHDKWGRWFQRAIRLPTRQLAVHLDLPLDHDPQVWGVETSLSAEERPLRTPVRRREETGRALFDWSTHEPVPGIRYRLQWRFRATPAAGGPSTAHSDPLVRERLRALGIVQRGAAALTEPARRFVLPTDREHARQVVEQLLAALDRVAAGHPSGKGLGLAAPQLGLGWAAVVVRPPGPDTEPVTLLNPRVVDAGPETDEQYEGCLSFFDLRGLVSRPLRLDVEHVRPDGSLVITQFEYAMARLVAHEIDHLDGHLYPDRMGPDTPLVPVEEYRHSGR